MAVSRSKARGSELWVDDREFLEILADLEGRTLVTPDRLFFICQFARHARSLAGDVAQVGVYKGGAARLIARIFSTTNKTVHLFDTFSGMPQPDPQKDNLAYVRREIFSDTSLKQVQQFLADCGNVRFYKGLFPDTAAAVREKKFSFVYLDADLYKSTRDGIEFFYPRMVSGGVVIFDDYASEKCPGVRAAVDEFVADKNESIIRTVAHQALLIKHATSSSSANSQAP